MQSWLFAGGVANSIAIIVIDPIGMLASPPSDRPLQRKLDYFVLAEQVAAGLRGTNVNLDKIFDGLRARSGECQ